ncbi:hypothetical protein [Nocardia lijiangensis]|uniref:hypothetical protein n=1 Tax=Nocardia lijiangensis TaxID=299618 RepID=UPI003D706C80
MTPASAARAYARVMSGRALDSQARAQVPVATPINGPTTTPQVPTTPPKPPKQETPAAPTQAPPTGTVPAPPPAPAPPGRDDAGDGDMQHRMAQPATPAAPAQSAPAPTSPPQQPGVTVPPPADDPLQAANGPNTDPLPMPSTEGREVGKPWTEKLGSNTVEFTIPEGNGLNSVDAVVRDADGKVLSRARIVAIEGTAKYKRWQDYADGGASYYESGGPNTLGYGQHFAPGTSTAGVPTQIFETSPDLSMTRTLSLDSDGNVIGVDIGIRNPLGLYDNVHIDNFENVTLSSTRFSSNGNLESEFTGQVYANRSGWMIDENDNHWEGLPDKDGKQSWLRVQDGHTYRMNHLGVITDFSIGKDGMPRLDTVFPDGSSTTKSGRTTVHFGTDGKEQWRSEPAAPQLGLATRGKNAVGSGLSTLGTLISDTLGAPFHMQQDAVRGMSSIRVDQYGTFHVTYAPPNRFTNAGKALIGLAEGTLMFYLAVPKYAVTKGYDALRGSELVRGSTRYQPPDREDQLATDLTGIPLKQWEDDTFGSAVEFGTVAAGGLLIFRAVGVKPRGGTRSSEPKTPTAGGRGLNGLWSSTSARFAQLTTRTLKYVRSYYDILLKLSESPTQRFLPQRPVGAPRGTTRTESASKRSTVDLEHDGHTSRNVWGRPDQIERATGSSSRNRQRTLEAILNSPDFKNFRFTHRPVYSPTVYTGLAHPIEGIQIGRVRFGSRLDLRTSIVHEELHHRWSARGLRNHHPRDGSGTSKQFYDTVERYLKFRGWM